jgi:hypothetical protein
MNKGDKVVCRLMMKIQAIKPFIEALVQIKTLLELKESPFRNKNPL